MKRNQHNSLVAQLNRIKNDLDVFSHPDSRAAFLVALDEFISRLNTIRDQLTSPELGKKFSEIGRPLEQVTRFLEYAKNDDLLSALLSDALESKSVKPKRTPVEILENLRNDQIRELLLRDLSKQELKAIAAQRGISFGKKSDEEVKRDLLRALDRQEGYQRLASSSPVSE